MLDAAVCGEVFTSPTPDQILAAIQTLDTGAGVLQLVKNYTGDVMNFEMATELAGATAVETVRASPTMSRSRTRPSRRVDAAPGVTVLVEKIVGAAAEQGRDLAEVAALARRVAGAGRSMGMALTSATLPASGKPNFELGDAEMEVGVGIHGEPGRRRVPLAGAREIAEMLVEPILADADFGGAPAIVMLNGMGATPLIELYVMFGEVSALLEKAGVTCRAQPGRQLHHVARHGGLLGHRASGRRRDARASGMRRSRHPALRWGV